MLEYTVSLLALVETQFYGGLMILITDTQRLFFALNIMQNLYYSLYRCEMRLSMQVLDMENQ